MKLLRLILLFSLPFLCIANSDVKIIGAVKPKVLKEINESFKSGTDVFLGEHVFKVLPPNSESRIMQITNTDNVFNIYLRLPDNMGHERVEAKYVCDEIPCKLRFYTDGKVTNY